MIKKKLNLVALLFLSIAANAQDAVPFYYQVVSNPSKTINFVFGFYPTTYSYVEGKDLEPYTSVKAAVINNADNSIYWNNYKIMILLKSGKLIRSYTTVAKTGDYSCEYNVKSGETHHQYYCFHKKFTNEDIDKVWLVMGDDEIFNLLYDKNER